MRRTSRSIGDLSRVKPETVHDLEVGANYRGRDADLERQRRTRWISETRSRRSAR